jgi:hypothetical protein
MKLQLAIALMLLLGACATDDYAVIHPPNYDALIGKRFADAIYKGPLVYSIVRETPTIQEWENRRSDGCVLVFGVRKADQVIEYWRVDSGPGTCLVSKKALNV